MIETIIKCWNEINWSNCFNKIQLDTLYYIIILLKGIKDIKMDIVN